MTGGNGISHATHTHTHIHSIEFKSTLLALFACARSMCACIVCLSFVIYWFFNVMIGARVYKIFFSSSHFFFLCVCLFRNRQSSEIHNLLSIEKCYFGMDTVNWFGIFELACHIPSRQPNFYLFFHLRVAVVHSSTLACVLWTVRPPLHITQLLTCFWADCKNRLCEWKQNHDLITWISTANKYVYNIYLCMPE